MRILILVLMAAVVLVLIAGVVLMARGGEANKKYGNKLMVARVGLQAGVIGLLGLMWLFSSHG